MTRRFSLLALALSVGLFAVITVTAQSAVSLDQSGIDITKAGLAHPLEIGFVSPSRTSLRLALNSGLRFTFEAETFEVTSGSNGLVVKAKDVTSVTSGGSVAPLTRKWETFEMFILDDGKLVGFKPPLGAIVR